MDFPVDPLPNPSSSSSTSDLNILPPSPSSPIPCAAPPVVSALDDSAQLEPRRNPPRDRRPPARYVAATSYSTEFGSFLAVVHAVQEPTSYCEAVQHVKWRQAMSEELSALESTGTLGACGSPSRSLPRILPMDI
ncbi:hypothetical protein NL676_000306 [Syzygium grande]|nr:hypothetical protein NL676_000306 [Syzygium grande]